MEFLFWMSVGLILYAYIGYPASIAILSLFVKNTIKTADIEPSVSLLITAYNEEKDIGRKIDNCFNLDYPKDKIEIVVASDGSTDNTDRIVEQYKDNEGGRRIILHRVEGRVGKTATQNSAVDVCSGDIIIFSDAASLYKPDAVRKIVRNYFDSNVGAVSGRYEYIKKGAKSAGLATILFWKFENFIKSRQSNIKTITGCCGCIYSIRKKLYNPLPSDIISDLVEPLTILKSGYRIVFEPEAMAFEETAGDTKEEFSMRIRVIVRGMNGLIYMRDLLKVTKYPFVAFQLISHKILRWLVPIFAIVAFLSNMALFLESWIYSTLFLGQLAFYILAVKGYYNEKKGIHQKIFYMPLYFCTVNLASIISMVKILKRERIIVWQTKR